MPVVYSPYGWWLSFDFGECVTTNLFSHPCYAFGDGRALFSPSNLGNQGQSQTGVAVEEELQGDVQNLALDNGVSGGGSGLLQVNQVGGVTNHVGVAQSVTGSLGQLVPDM